MYTLDLTNKTALVTGGSRGIGRAIAESLIKAGAKVIITGVNKNSTEQVAQEIGAEKAIAVNFLENDSVEKLVSEIDKVDILVNNAGITKDGLFVKQTQEQWNDVITVNLSKIAELTKALIPNMTRQGNGRIINIASVVAHMGNLGQTNYVTAKAGLTGFTKALATEVARKNVTINCVAPGFIKTDMTKDLPEKVTEMMLAKIPAKRFGEVQEIADAVVFLASDKANYINGTTIHVNGGMYM